MRKAVSVSNSVIEICPASEMRGDFKAKINNLVIKNTSATVVYLQWTVEPDVLTSSNGYPLGQNEVAIIERTKTSAPVIGITAGGIATLRVRGD